MPASPWPATGLHAVDQLLLLLKPPRSSCPRHGTVPTPHRLQRVHHARADVARQLVPAVVGCQVVGSEELVQLEAFYRMGEALHLPGEEAE